MSKSNERALSPLCVSQELAEFLISDQTQTKLKNRFLQIQSLTQSSVSADELSWPARRCRRSSLSGVFVADSFHNLIRSAAKIMFPWRSWNCSGTPTFFSQTHEAHPLTQPPTCFYTHISWGTMFSCWHPSCRQTYCRHPNYRQIVDRQIVDISIMDRQILDVWNVEHSKLFSLAIRHIVDISTCQN
jgi:hypothetical protein